MFPNTYVVVRTLLQKQSDGIGIKQFTFLLDIWFPFMSRLEHVIEKRSYLLRYIQVLSVAKSQTRRWHQVYTFLPNINMYVFVKYILSTDEAEDHRSWLSA